MSKFSILFVLSILLGFVSCKEEHAKKKVITETKQKKKKVEKKIEKNFWHQKIVNIFLILLVQKTQSLFLPNMVKHIHKHD